MKKIVAVDDNKMFIETIKDFIQMQKDFECITFTNPEDALRYVFDNEDVYAVVSDYEMPQLDGLHLAKKIIEENACSKIIIMSGHDTNYLKKKATEANLDVDKVYFLCKLNIINLPVILNS